MVTMKQLVESKVGRLKEDFFTIDDDLNGRMKISATPVSKYEVKKLTQLGQGLRILVGADKFRKMLVVWAGDSNSNIGAMHDTVADQFGMSLHHERHVPLEMTPSGKLRVTTTALENFTDAREIEDVLDRNNEFRSIFGNQKIDYSVLREAETLDPPQIEVGDEVRIGKFKNRKATVKGFKKDEHNHPVLKTTKGDQQLFKPRLTKIINK